MRRNDSNMWPENKEDRKIALEDELFPKRPSEKIDTSQMEKLTVNLIIFTLALGICLLILAGAVRLALAILGVEL